MTDPNPADAVRFPLAMDAEDEKDLPAVVAWVVQNKDFILTRLGSGNYVIVSPLPADLTTENRDKLIRYLGTV